MLVSVVKHFDRELIRSFMNHANYETIELVLNMSDFDKERFSSLFKNNELSFSTKLSLINSNFNNFKVLLNDWAINLLVNLKKLNQSCYDKVIFLLKQDFDFHESMFILDLIGQELNRNPVSACLFFKENTLKDVELFFKTLIKRVGVNKSFEIMRYLYFFSYSFNDLNKTLGLENLLEIIENKIAC